MYIFMDVSQFCITFYLGKVISSNQFNFLELKFLKIQMPVVVLTSLRVMTDHAFQSVASVMAIPTAVMARTRLNVQVSISYISF